MFKNLPNWYVVTLTLLAVLLAVYFFANVIIYILVAVLLSFAGRPVMRFLNRRQIRGKHLPRSLSAVLTILVMVIISLGVLAVFVPLIAMQVRQVAETDMAAVALKLQPAITWVEQQLDWFGVMDFYGQSLSDYLQHRAQAILSFSFVSTFAGSVFGVLGSIGIGVASTFFILFFFLKDRDLFQRILMLLIDDAYEAKVMLTLEKVKNMLTRYILGILLQLACNFAFLAIVLGILGINNFLLIALLGAVLNIIPYVGPFLGAVVGLLIAVTGHLEMDFATELVPLILKVVLTFGFDQMLDNYILQPVIFSKSANAHPLEIFVVILAAGTIGGIGAMIFAIPVYTVARVIAKEFFSENKFINALTKDL